MGEFNKPCDRLVGYLYQGEVSPEKFHLLVELSNIYSERILLALELYLVRGLERRRACEKAGISQSCFSVKLRRMQDVSRTVIRLYSWYSSSVLDKIGGESEIRSLE
ncbi:TPA: transcriptional regulator [Escherichia coli]|nr:transcriptional regulator [Escherichia coli]HCQ0091580.1 transcriptional regulator [Escherichia coli]